MTDALDLNLFDLPVEIWPDYERTIVFYFGEADAPEDPWVLRVQHAFGGSPYETTGVEGAADADEVEPYPGLQPGPKITFTIDAEDVWNLRRQVYIIEEDDRPVGGGVFVEAKRQHTPGPTVAQVYVGYPTPAQVTAVIVEGGGGGGGVTDHEDLDGRDEPEQHPIGAIEGLPEALNAKAGLGANTFTGTQAVDSPDVIAWAEVVAGAEAFLSFVVRNEDGDPVWAAWSFVADLEPLTGSPIPARSQGTAEWTAGGIHVQGSSPLGVGSLDALVDDLEILTLLGAAAQKAPPYRAAGGSPLGAEYLVVGDYEGSGDPPALYETEAPTLGSTMVTILDHVPILVGAGRFGSELLFGELATIPHPTLDLDQETAPLWWRGEPYEFFEFTRDIDPEVAHGEFEDGRIYGYETRRPANATHWNTTRLLSAGRRCRWASAVVGDDGAGGWWSAVLRPAETGETPDQFINGEGWKYHKRRAGSGAWGLANYGTTFTVGLNDKVANLVHSVEVFASFDDGDDLAIPLPSLRASELQGNGTVVDGQTSAVFTPSNDPRHIDWRWETLEEGGTSGLVPESRTLAGLDLTTDRSASALLAALATGTPSGSNYLRGDGTWSAPTAAVERPELYRTSIYHPLMGQTAARQGPSVTTTTANEGLWQFILPLEDIGITGAAWFCGTGQSGALARLWLYRVTAGLPAGSPLIDSGTITAATSAAYLNPTWTRVNLVGGRLYAVRIGCDTANVTWRQWFGDAGETPQTIALGSTAMNGRILSFADSTGIGAAPGAPPTLGTSGKYPPCVMWQMAR